MASLSSISALDKSSVQMSVRVAPSQQVKCIGHLDEMTQWSTHLALMPPPGGRPSISSTANRCITYCDMAASGGPDFMISTEISQTQGKLKPFEKPSSYYAEWKVKTAITNWTTNAVLNTAIAQPTADAFNPSRKPKHIKIAAHRQHKVNIV